jgi:hypothetical protein
MTSCRLCAKVVNNISQNFNQCDFSPRDCIRMEITVLYFNTKPSIGTSYQISVHLATQFQRRRLKCEKLMDDGHQVMAKAHIAFGKIFSIFHFKQINLIFKKYTSIIFSTLFMFYLGQKKIMCVSDCIVFKIKVGRIFFSFLVHVDRCFSIIIIQV